MRSRRLACVVVKVRFLWSECVRGVSRLFVQIVVDMTGRVRLKRCLLFTSYAADEEDSVGHGRGRTVEK